MPYANPADRWSYVEWAQTYRAALTRRARKILHNVHDAEDVVQGVLLRIASDADLRHRIAGARNRAGYLSTIVRNAAIDALRQRRPVTAGPRADADSMFVAGEPSPERAFEQRLLNHEYDRIHNLLTPEQQMLFVELRRAPEAGPSALVEVLKWKRGKIRQKRCQVWAVARRELEDWAPVDLPFV